MSDLTQVQIHFVRDIYNHRLRFGTPDETIKLDRYRKLALFKPTKTFGYIRWHGNKYGTQDWRVYVLKSGVKGDMIMIDGIEPAANVLLSIHGTERVKRTLKVIDRIEKTVKGGLETVPDSYWKRVHTSILNKSTFRELPNNRINFEACYAQ